MKVKFVQGFKHSLTNTNNTQWIMEKCDSLIKRHGVRNYLKMKWLTEGIIIHKTLAQVKEVENIADLARLLFTALIQYDLVPSDYLVILAVAMN